ncbi:MAG TPA: heavy metal sensor histidine kinase [Burkholderiaceae bacterium]|nr:heavy metal sensor histidine kinase [Rhodoferax sp.]HNW00470.1 heavy metal sensor histidine kinase [Burkholderiaceae bacterium]MBP6492721.1 heavy metal sensor histidine kinase [Rhodoferax sp.]MBP7572559.1 heavy metal sensor histidine kinase [Rhodoferax sp.]MBP8134716.1 heavy metal sensor histidine kinase [Rhodoferax sp.]
MLGRLSLTARLTALYTLVSAVVLVGLGILVVFATSRHFVELDRDYLLDKIGLIQKIVRESPSSDLLSTKLDELLGTHHGLFIDLRQGGRLVHGADVMVFPPSLPLADPQGAPIDWTEGDRTLRGMKATLEGLHTSGSSDSTQTLQLLIATDTEHHAHFMWALCQTLATYLLGAILISGFLGWWAARSGLAPLRIMKERAMTVTAQKLDQRMPIEAVPVEFADLAQSLNTMLERLQADFTRLQEFSSDLAHELRTPINNLLTQTQVSLAQRRDAATYQDILASNAEEFQRLARMVSDMLFLAKTEHGIELPHRETVSLLDEVHNLVDFYEALADENQIQLVATGDAQIVCDRLMVRRAISNLLSNAIRYSPNQESVEILISQLPGEVRLSVQNTGPAIDRNDLPRLFDRFYRVEKSRSHGDSEGTGLGLSITKAIMNAHGGSASVKSSGRVTTFCLNFPHRAQEFESSKSNTIR